MVPSWKCPKCGAINSEGDIACQRCAKANKGQTTTEYLTMIITLAMIVALAILSVAPLTRALANLTNHTHGGIAIDWSGTK